MDALSQFFLTAPDWVWVPLIGYAAISFAWAVHKIGFPDVPVWDDEAGLFLVGVYLVIGVFWPLAVLWKVAKRTGLLNGKAA